MMIKKRISKAAVMVSKSLFVLFSVIAILSVAHINIAYAALQNNDMSARVKGMQSGNWEIGLGDDVGVSGGFVQATGDDPWLGTSTYNFVLNYHASTGRADFQVTGTGFASPVLTTPDYGITGYGFSGVSLGLKARNDAQWQTTLTLDNLILNGSSIAGPIVGTTTYTNHTLYSGSLLHDIILTGDFVFTNDGVGLNESTKFDLYLTGSAVPIPAAFWLLGSGLVGLIGLRRRSREI